MLDLNAHKLGPLITCLEQNEEIPYGYVERTTWSNLQSEICINYPDLCEAYLNEEPFPGTGDVCDHTDPLSGITRNACGMTVTFGETEDPQKTWSWKCAEISQCPLPDREGCLITNKRIMCCCQTDYCTADPLYAEYAKWGRASMWPPNYDEIIAIPHPNVVVEVSIPGYDVSSDDYSYSSDGSDDEVVNQYTMNENNSDQISIEMCLIIEAEVISCSCGYECSSTKYKYKATVDNKCGDQILVTGAYGEEQCNPFNDNIIYQIGQSYSCKVLSCDNGEFDILDDAFLIKSHCILITMFYYIILH